jgi:hypothetical protein
MSSSSGSSVPEDSIFVHVLTVRIGEVWVPLTFATAAAALNVARGLALSAGCTTALKPDFASFAARTFACASCCRNAALAVILDAFGARPTVVDAGSGFLGVLRGAVPVA